MSLFDVSVEFGNPDPEFCPTTFLELIAELNSLVDASIVGNFVAYLRQAETPGVDQQNLVWHKIDQDGRPIGTYHFYGGAWRREYSGRQDEIRYFMGDPAIHFESNGRGIVGGEWDGFALCNGNNGTPNLSDKFIVGAKMDDLAAGYPVNGPWKTSVSGTSEQSGGQKDITLTAETTYKAPTDAVIVGRNTADGNTPASGGPLYGSNMSFPATIIPADEGHEEPDAIPTLPPFYAMALTKWIGYS